MTRDDFIGRFPIPGDAIEFENRALSIGGEFLPTYVRLVRDGHEEPGSDYWAWLCDQLDGMAS